MIDSGVEIPLAGGNENVVVRVGDTVRRPVHAWTPAVHALLQHLEAVGFDAAPRAQGFDAQGREVLTFRAGEVGNYPLSPAMASDGALVAVADLMRRFHAAAVMQPGWEALPWRTRFPEREQWEVICHSDIAPYNTVYEGEMPVGLIDFDVAGPAPRLWDVAYAAYRFVPLASDANCVAFGFGAGVDRIGRLRQFLEAYGLEDASGLVEMVQMRVEGLRDDILQRAAAGDPGVAVHLAEDHVGSYNADLAWIGAHAGEIAGVLG